MTFDPEVCIRNESPRTAGQKEEAKMTTSNTPNTVVNLTPHDIALVDDQGFARESYPRSGTIARVQGLPLGPVEGLPPPQEGTLYIVSVIVAERLPERRDLRVPGDQVRDAQGRIVGCRSLLLPEETSPALAMLLAKTAAPEGREVTIAIEVPKGRGLPSSVIGGIAEIREALKWQEAISLEIFDPEGLIPSAF